MRLNETSIDLSEAIEQGSMPIVRRQDATWEQVHELLKEDPDEGNRSQYQWFRLPNGDLILGFFPQDTAYMDISPRIKV